MLAAMLALALALATPAHAGDRQSPADLDSVLEIQPGTPPIDRP
jgi:hypothetical protein